MAPRPPAPLPLATNPIQAIEQHPVATGLITVVALIVLVLLGLLTRRLLRTAVRLRTRVSAEHLLTVLAAGIATSVAAQGMWQFFGDVLGFSGPLRVLTFAFIEVSVITSAVRARTSMRESLSAGVDGIAVWVLTCLSAVLSSLDARSFGEVVLRLSAPLVAAWLWERGMALERRRITGRTQINWRLTPERILVRIGLADPTDRNAGEVDAHRRMMRLALAAKHARTARMSDGKRAQKAQRKALARLERAMEGAVEYGGLGTDPVRQDMLLSQLGVLYNATSLLDVEATAPWARSVPGSASGSASGPMPGPMPGSMSGSMSGSVADSVPGPVPGSAAGSAAGVTLPDGPDRVPRPAGDRTPGHETPRHEPEAGPPAEGRFEERTREQPAPPRPRYAAADHPADDGSADMPTAGIPQPRFPEPDKTSARFFDALTKHNGSVPKARTDMEAAGLKPPSRNYAYVLRKTWLSRHISSDELTRVS